MIDEWWMDEWIMSEQTVGGWQVDGRIIGRWVGGWMDGGREGGDLDRWIDDGWIDDVWVGRQVDGGGGQNSEESIWYYALTNLLLICLSLCFTRSYRLRLITSLLGLQTHPGKIETHLESSDGATGANIH